MKAAWEAAAFVAGIVLFFAFGWFVFPTFDDVEGRPVLYQWLLCYTLFGFAFGVMTLIAAAFLADMGDDGDGMEGAMAFSMGIWAVTVVSFVPWLLWFIVRLWS